MKKTVKKLIADVLIITTLISIFALAGCGVKNSDNANADVQDGVTFTDALGRSVTVKSADRTASLLGSFSDVWLLAESLWLRLMMRGTALIWDSTILLSSLGRYLNRM